MKTNFKLKRYIPASILQLLDNPTYNKDIFTEQVLDKEALIILIDTVIRMASTRNVDENEFVQIPAIIFKSHIKDEYKIHLEWLIDNRIIFCDNQYINGEKAKSYKLNVDLIPDNDVIVSVEITQDKYNRRALNQLKLNKNNRLKLPRKIKENFLQDFTIDYNAATLKLTQDYINEVPDHKGRVMSKWSKICLQHKLLIIHESDLDISRSNTNGRVNSNLTTLNGNYKQFINGYDYNVDVTSSQPTLLVVLFKLIEKMNEGKLSDNWNYLKLYIKNRLSANVNISVSTEIIKSLKDVTLPTNRDLGKYSSLCSNGDLYETIQSTYNRILNTNLSRSEIKQDLFRFYFSGTRNPTVEYQNMKKVFEYLFPSIYKSINQLKNLIKGKSHQFYSIILQSIESYIFIEQVSKDLSDKGLSYFTIHDAIVCKNKDVDYVNIKICEFFYRYGVNVNVKNEKLN